MLSYIIIHPLKTANKDDLILISLIHLKSYLKLNWNDIMTYNMFL